MKQLPNDYATAYAEAYSALPRYLGILAAIAVVIIGFMIWTFYAGLPETWRTLLSLLNIFADGVLVFHFILKPLRKARLVQRTSR